MTSQRQALGTLSQSKRNAQRMDQAKANILSKDDIFTGLPVRLLASRVGARRSGLSGLNTGLEGPSNDREETPLQKRLSELSLNVAAIETRTGKESKTTAKPTSTTTPRLGRRVNKDGIAIWQDELQEPEPVLPPPPPTPQQRKKVVIVSPKRDPPPPPAKPSALTQLLLSHASPAPSAPALTLPTPPRSRSRPAASAALAAQRLDAPTVTLSAHPDTTDPSPLKLLRQLRTHLHASRPAPPTAKPAAPEPAPTAAASTPNQLFNPHSFTLTHLPPLSHHTEHSIISLHPPSHVTLLLRDPSVGGSNTVYTLRPHGGPVTITNRATGERRDYALADLPWQHIAAYRYTLRFVAAVRKRTVVAYGGVDGASGRLWADGRAVVDLGPPGGDTTAVEVQPGGSVVAPGKLEAAQVDLVRRVYQWLTKHPAPRFEAEGEETVWEVDKETAFVLGVGWCREREDGAWSMRFLDGVRMEVRQDGEVVWREGGGKKVLKRGMEEAGVRRRVAAFVKAGL
ncbi:hypothetical protein EDC01DRAFT_647369 [Geopyxis carbonaria]|nr:hypothetical protein EDC01DRAFT_647369 [Geopyxis carbonaria]